MNQDVISHFAPLVLSLVFTFAALSYYRGRTLPETQRYLTFGPRFLASFVDDCVLWPVGFIAVILLTSDLPRSVAAIALVVQSLAWLLYTVVMHASRGQTVGKMVTKVRVVDHRTEGSISWRQAWIREGIPLLLTLGLVVWEVVHLLDGTWSYGSNAVDATVTNSRTFWILASLPAWWFLAEAVTMLTNKKRRALHDFIAGTVVTRTNTGALAQRTAEAPSEGTQQADPVEAMWSAFVAAHPEMADPDDDFWTWHFGDDEAVADELAELVVSGRKRATASLLWAYEAEDEPFPQVGAFNMITDWDGRPTCIIRTTAVEVVPFDEVSDEHAAAEGEGDGSLAYWREVHTRAFAKDLADIGRNATPDMPVVLERFEVVFAR